jgi:hypothetical protein
MAMKRRLLVGVALAACLAVGGLLVLLPLTVESKINPTQIQAVAVGMTRTEVEQLLGGPPRNECTGPVDIWVRRDGGLRSAGIDPGQAGIRFFPEAAPGAEAVWVGDEGLIAVRFGLDGRVQEKHVSNVIVVDSPRRSFATAVVRWLQR